GSAPCRHCVTAFCGLRPLVLQGEVSPCEPLWPAFQLILVYQSQLSIRDQGGDFRHPAFRPAGQPSAVQFCSNKIVHAPARSFGIIQTMLLALPNIGLERMGREKPQQPDSLLAACGRNNFSFSFSFWFCAQSAPNSLMPA